MPALERPSSARRPPARPDADLPPPVCITGMHRSGNAMVAQVLSVCGLWLGPPERMLGPRPDNPDGFFQSIDGVFLNDLVLGLQRGGWDEPPRLRRGYQFSDFTIELADELPVFASLMAQGAANAAQAQTVNGWGWTDPRTSLTLPFWDAVVPNLQVVACLRNPVAVAESLRARGNSSLHFGLRLWEDYNQRLAEALPSGQTLITHYDAWFVDAAAELERVLAFLGWRVSADVRAAAVACVKPDYRHRQPVSLDWLVEHRGPAARVLYDGLRAQAGEVYAATPEGQQPSLAPLIEENDPGAHDGMQWIADELARERNRNAELQAQLAGAADAGTAPRNYAIQPGDSINFRAGGNSLHCVGPGWSAPEESGTWSIATVMHLGLRLAKHPESAVLLTARLLPFVGESHALMRIQLVVNGVDVALWHLTDPEMQGVDAIIDPALLGPDGEMNVLLVALDARSPLQLGLSDDQRRLGIFVQEISVSLVA